MQLVQVVWDALHVLQGAVQTFAHAFDSNAYPSSHLTHYIISV